MSRFSSNTKLKQSSPQAPAVTNLAGAPAFGLSRRLELATLVLTSFFADRFYAKAGDDQDRIVKLVNEAAIAGDLEFAAKTALYARHVHGLRSTSHVLAAEIARVARKAPWLKRFLRQIVFRPDDMKEIASYYALKYTDGKVRQIPNAMRRGFALAMEEMSGYQLAKYNGNDGVTLVDLVNICHPRSTKNEALTALMKGKLASADTWETALTEAGKVAESEGELENLKADAWMRLLVEKKLGIFACLRNLRNIIQQAPEAAPLAAALLTNKELISKSKILPFQFEKAAKVLRALPDAEGRNRLALALDEAQDFACDNVPRFDGSTLIALDTSGSMNGDPIEIGSLFAAILMKSNPTADLMWFHDRAGFMRVNPRNSVSTIKKEINDQRTSGGTCFAAIFAAAKQKYDRIIILSDMQSWQHDTPRALKAYRAQYPNCHPFLYSFDLNGHGTSQFPEERICTVAGWSDKVFEVMKLGELDRTALVKIIEAHPL